MESTINPHDSPRRCTRIRTQIPLRLTRLDTAVRTSERCYTLVVNPQGCGVRLSTPLGRVFQYNWTNCRAGQVLRPGLRTAFRWGRGASIGWWVWPWINRETFGASVPNQRTGDGNRTLRFRR